MKRLLIIAVLGAGAFLAGAGAAEKPAEKPRPRLISTPLSGREVGFVREMGESSVLLRKMARVASKQVKTEAVKDFAASIAMSLDEEFAGLEAVAKAETIDLPADPSATQRDRLKALREDGLTAGEFLTGVIKVRSEQLRAIQRVETTDSQPIRNFAAAMLKTIQDELIFIQLLSAKTQKEAADEARVKPR